MLKDKCSQTDMSTKLKTTNVRRRYGYIKNDLCEALCPCEIDEPYYILRNIISNRLQNDSVLQMATKCFFDSEGNLLSSDDQILLKTKLFPSCNESNNHPFYEVEVMKTIMELPHHPNILYPTQMLQSNNSLILVFPFISSGDLFSYTTNKRVSEDETKKIISKVIESLVFLTKDVKVVHHDISLENILLDTSGTPFLIDFGLTLPIKNFNTNLHNFKPHKISGNPQYIAPEIVNLKPLYDPIAADVWSLGVCMYVMVTGMTLYASPSDSVFTILQEKDGISKIINHDTRHNNCCFSPAFTDLLRKMLNSDPKKRPHLEDLLLHPFFTNISPPPPTCLVYFRKMLNLFGDCIKQSLG